MLLHWLLNDIHGIIWMTTGPIGCAGTASYVASNNGPAKVGQDRQQHSWKWSRMMTQNNLSKKSKGE
jgi:hypothetical protein